MHAPSIIGYASGLEREFLAAGLEAGATLVVPNSAIRGALPQVLHKLARRLENAGEQDGETFDPS